MKHLLPELKFNLSDLDNVISKETFEYHHWKHLNWYINNLNNLIVWTEFENMSLEEIILKSSGPIYNNAAQTWNHIFYFNQFTSISNFTDELLFVKQLEKTFWSIDEFKKQMTAKAVWNFGSWWTWLVVNKDNTLEIVNTSNAWCALNLDVKPIFVIDVWEHAYYIDYRNDRATHVSKIFDIIDWEELKKICLIIILYFIIFLCQIYL